MLPSSIFNYLREEGIIIHDTYHNHHNHDTYHNHDTTTDEVTKDPRLRGDEEEDTDLEK